MSAGDVFLSRLRDIADQIADIRQGSGRDEIVRQEHLTSGKADQESLHRIRWHLAVQVASTLTFGTRVFRHEKAPWR